MIIPLHDYTLREHWFIELFKTLNKEDYKTLLNVWFHGYKDIRNHWWIRLCQVNNIDWYILEIFEQNIINAMIDWMSQDRFMLWNILDLKWWFTDILFFWHWPEHCDKNEFINKLDKIESKVNKLIVFWFPNWNEIQWEEYWNKYEQHLSAWSENDWHKLWYKTVLINDWNFNKTKVWHIMAYKFKKNFKEDFDIFLNKLKNKESHSIVRFWDWEMFVIEWTTIDLSEKLWWEHKYIPWNEEDEKSRWQLTESLLYKDDNYFVWIPCKCCVWLDRHIEIKNKSKQIEENLTWANIFVNSNYKKFKDEYIKELSNHDIVMIVNKNAKVDQLPFAKNIQKTFYVWWNSWVNDLWIIQEIKDYAKTRSNTIFLFCAWVLSNIAIYELHKTKTNNTYLDMWSVFDDMMWLWATRWYLNWADTLEKVCVW